MNYPWTTPGFLFCVCVCVVAFFFFPSLYIYSKWAMITFFSNIKYLRCQEQMEILENPKILRHADGMSSVVWHYFLTFPWTSFFFLYSFLKQRTETHLSFMVIWEIATLTRRYQNTDNSVAQSISQSFRKFSQNNYLLLPLLLLLMVIVLSIRIIFEVATVF